MSDINVIDSTLWLEYFNGTLEEDSVISIIENPSKQFVPSICVYEVYKKMLVDKDEESAKSSTSFMKRSAVISLNPRIAEFAAKLGKQHKLPMADSIIYATTKIYKAELYTQDKHFENLENVHYFQKKL